jgi:RNA polymerase sigma-70 factor (ECF subfamily)
MVDGCTIRRTQELVALAQGGDALALDQLCRVYGERVLRIVRLRMGSALRARMQSMDLVQDVFVSALKDLTQFEYRDDGDFLRWLSKIAENRIRDTAKRFHAAKRDARREVPLCDAAAGSPGRGREPVRLTTPSVIVSASEDLDRLENAMTMLKPEYHQVIVMAEIEDLSYPEIAAELGKSADATRMLLARAMAALSSAFGRV